MVTCEFVQRRLDLPGAQFKAHTDIFIRDDAGNVWYSRVPWVVDNTPHARAAELQAFAQRQKRAL